MNIEANKAIVRKYIELWSTGNLALADEVLAADFVIIGIQIKLLAQRGYR